MGVETLVALGVGAKTAATIGTVASGLSTALSVASGISSLAEGSRAKAESKYQANLALDQAQQAGRESVRVADREAQFAQQEAGDVRRRQKMAYLASGVSLEGSPLLVMEATRLRGAENVQEIYRAGSANAGSAFAEGRTTAQRLKQQGRADFYTGLKNAGSAFSRLL